MPRLDRGPSSLTPRWREMDSNHPVDQDRAFPFKAEQDLLIRGVTVLANVAPGRNDLDTHRQIVGTAMLGTEFDDRIAIRPNRLPMGLALFGLQYYTAESRWYRRAVSWVGVERPPNLPSIKKAG